jgi:ribonucleotide monophosphatase NagD (HAD superfamily)
MSSAPSSCATEPVPQLSGLAAIAEDFELFLVDLWGVMHDGVRAFPAALDCVLRLREAGRKVVLVSNAPRRSA